jgi:hypothetical protein
MPNRHAVEPLGMWKIVTTFYDHNFQPIGYETHNTYYKHKSSAVRRARQLWGLNPFVSWVVKPTEDYK